MTQTFTQQVGANYSPSPEEPIMDSLLSEYKRVIFESLISSFALDQLLFGGRFGDQYGGDVDTIHNVRQIDHDPNMTYKNVLNEKAYAQKSAYNTKTYHSDKRFADLKHEKRETYRTTGATVTDAYTGKELHFLGKGKGANSKISAEVDHVISAKSIDEDRGRVLSGLSGVDLANSPENLRFTNKSLNASMGADEIPDYVAQHPELDEKTKENMLHEYETAKKSYENKLARAYYTSPAFVKDVGFAAGKVGVQMGVRQALGFVFTEVTFTVFDEFKKLSEPFDLEKLFQSLGEGIKKGFQNVKKKYKDLLARIEQGLTAGILSSLTTTLCNIFFTTAKNVVRIIRQTYTSLVEAAKVLFLNPDDLPFGERLRATSKILSTGVSIVLGTIVSELIEQTPVGKIPVLGEAVQTFCGALVSGLLTCSLVYYFDRSEAMNRLVCVLNNLRTISTEVNYFKQQAALFEQYAAELEGLDYKKFQKEAHVFTNVVNGLDAAKDGKQLNELLKEYIALTGGSLPWKGDFDTFMRQKDTPLVFA